MLSESDPGFGFGFGGYGRGTGSRRSHDTKEFNR